MTDSHKISSGVQELITRVRDEGVQAGQQEADQIIQDAHKRAAEIATQARTEADSLLEHAHEEANAERTAVHNALKLAVRDTMLELKTRLATSFEAAVKRRVTTELKDKDFLRRMILSITERSVADETHAQTLEVLLSGELSPEDESGAESSHAFIQSIVSEMAQEGINLKPFGSKEAGIRLRVVGEEMEIDLTDEAISALLVKYLLPRYRSYVEEDVSKG